MLQLTQQFIVFMEDKPVEQAESVLPTPEEPKKNHFPKKGLVIGSIIVIVLLSLSAVAFFSYTQKNTRQVETKKIYRVGILSGIDLFTSVAESFKSEMKTLGYEEGKNIVYDFHHTNFEPEKEKRILQGFVNDNVDLVFGYNTEVALAAKKATKDTKIPLVFANSLVEGTGLIENISNPGGNVTGVRYPGLDIALKRFEIMHEMLPNAKRIWIPYQKKYPYVANQLKLLRDEAKKLDLTLIEFSAENTASLDAELKRRSMEKDIGFEAVLFIPESLSTSKQAFETIAKYTRTKKIPIAGSSIITEDYGTIFAVTVDPIEIGILGAQLADKVLKGTKAGTIPVVSPDSILKINMKVANELGISVSDVLLAQTKEIIR